MTEIPTTILCRVVKKSNWIRPGERIGLKSITFDFAPGRYFSVGDERKSFYEEAMISLTCSEEIPAFFDQFSVGQDVEISIAAKEEEITHAKSGFER